MTAPPLAPEKRTIQSAGMEVLDQTISQDIFEQLPWWQQELIKLRGSAHIEIVVDEG